MRPKPDKVDRKHPDATRDAMEEIKDISGDPRPLQNDIRYMDPNRDRFLGEADRTGRHFDEVVETEREMEEDEGTKVSEDHEAD
jgi:hypothetical protein